MRKYDQVGVMTPVIYLPRPGIDLQKWAVIACDQFTSQPEYWDKVNQIVGESPSTFHLTLPEVYLGKPEEASRLEGIQYHMNQYLDENILVPEEGMIYVERTVSGKTRKGILLCLDLEKYDFNKGSSSLIRATEGTILDRLPPRIKIRENALLELPHILVLIDDPERTVIEAVSLQKEKLELLYQTDLMLGSGHIDGWRISDLKIEENLIRSLLVLANAQSFQEKYRLEHPKPVILFAMGDGNHSLATAKAIWEKIKSQVGLDHPARYALVEIENVHDQGLEFEPIHRILFETNRDIKVELQNYFGSKCSFRPIDRPDEMKHLVEASSITHQCFALVLPDGLFLVELDHPELALPVANLQAFLDSLMNQKGTDHIDYVHGEEIVLDLGKKPGNAGFYLPVMNKNELFRTVILDGALPRKTFSMGEAIEKRFYMESRKIC
jgi:hypothetical protein